MRRLPYIEPTIRSIAGGLATAAGISLYFWPDTALFWLGLLLFVSLNLFQSGFTGFCLMEKLLKKSGFRSEMDEIKALNTINAGHLETLNQLSEVVIELAPEGTLTRFTDSWCKLLGCSSSAANLTLGKDFVDYVETDDRHYVQQAIQQVKEGEIQSVRFRISRDDRAQHWVEAKFTLYRENLPLRLVRGILRDITESYLQEMQISHMATHDALTGLPNRVLLEDRMEMAVSHARRTGLKAALLFIDLDNFKQTNDLNGHKAGDLLLAAIGKILHGNIRDTDTVARWGGDEFVALLQGLKENGEAQVVAEKLLSAVQGDAIHEHLHAAVTFSIGIAVFPDDAESAETLLVHADRALFFAKSQGRNNVQAYSPNLAVERLPA